MIKIIEGCASQLEKSIQSTFCYKLLPFENFVLRDNFGATAKVIKETTGKRHRSVTVTQVYALVQTLHQVSIFLLIFSNSYNKQYFKNLSVPRKGIPFSDSSSGGGGRAGLASSWS